MNDAELKERTKNFARRTIKMCDALPRKMSAEISGRPLTCSAASVAANYRAACRAKSRADFIAKMGTVEEEADESAFGLEMIAAIGFISAQHLAGWRKEADELTAIAVRSIRTPRLRAANPRSEIRNPR